MMARSVSVTVEATARDGDVEFRISQRDLNRVLSALLDGYKRPLKGVPVLPATRSKIYHDPEVRDRLESLLPLPLTIDEMHARLVDVFGAERSPSRSAIGRYTRRRRLEIGFD